MFAAFKMKLTDIESYEFKENFHYFYRIGQSMYSQQENITLDTLSQFLSPEGTLISERIEDDWFPNIKANIFLSHSHLDETKVIALAGFLKKKFELVSFIDSCVWGYANDLLKQIDKEYCVLAKTPEGKITYNYDKRNYSTAHVHMILNGALMKMINKTECLIFLDTPNSIKTSDIDRETTNSCWIYNEILTSSIIKRIKPKRPIKAISTKILNESYGQRELSIDYNLDTRHLVELRFSDFEKVYKQVCKSNINCLDQLYYNKGLINGK